MEVAPFFYLMGTTENLYLGCFPADGEEGGEGRTALPHWLDVVPSLGRALKFQSNLHYLIGAIVCNMLFFLSISLLLHFLPIKPLMKYYIPNFLLIPPWGCLVVLLMPILLVNLEPNSILRDDNVSILVILLFLKDIYYFIFLVIDSFIPEILCLLKLFFPLSIMCHPLFLLIPPYPFFIPWLLMILLIQFLLILLIILFYSFPSLQDENITSTFLFLL